MKPAIGTRPKDANGIVFDYTEGDRDAALPLDGWILYRRAASTEQWLSLKLVRPGLQKASANFWLSWNHAEQRFGRSREMTRIPAPLLAAVERLLRAHKAMGVSPEDYSAALAERDGLEALLK